MPATDSPNHEPRLHPRTRVKICGITRVEDALTAASAGADAIGLVFYPRSPRAVTAAQAAAIATMLPPFINLVGLFVNASRDTLNAVLEQVPLGLLQFHGDETAAQCEGYGLPYIKAVRMRPQTDLLAQSAEHRGAAGLLLDAYAPDFYGGTGQRFAWESIPEALAGSIVLAGGLDAGNVGTAIRQVRPYAVDVSGGVEVSKGIKDPARVQAFMRAARQADIDGDAGSDE